MQRYIFKLFYISILIIIYFCSINTFECFSKDQNEIKNDHFKFSTIENNKDYVFIKISQKPPSFEEGAKEIFFELTKKYFDKNKIKISIIWQEDEFSYGINYSLAGVYIKDYLDKKITKYTFVVVVD